MPRFPTHFIPIALALAIAPLVSAQSPSQPTSSQDRQAAAPEAQLTPQQREALARQDAEMTQAARQVMQMVDTGRIGEAWEGASPAMQRSVGRDEFIKQVGLDRGKLGKPVERGPSTVTRAQFPAGGQIPQGLYVNVITMTRFANRPQPIRELVSFRLDEDKTWRVSGYSVRQDGAGQR